MNMRNIDLRIDFEPSIIVAQLDSVTAAFERLGNAAERAHQQIKALDTALDSATQKATRP